MDDLIEALTILRKYGNPRNPTYCSHDMLTLCISPDGVADEDIQRLDDLGVFVGEAEGCFASFRFGSA